MMPFVITPGLDSSRSRVFARSAVGVEGGWGRLPELSVIGATGLLLLALADTGARVSTWWSEPLFWIGLLALFVPIASRLFSNSASPQERLGLVVALALGLYLVKIIHSPTAFTLHDELGHWRSAEDILRYHHLFAENPIVRTYPFYPGLLLVTAALAQLGGISIFVAGIIILAVARIVGSIALFLFFDRIHGSSRLAGISALVYMCNPSFLFFDAQFSYESFALPLAAVALFAMVRRQHAGDESVGPWRVVIALAIGGVIVSHHMTSYGAIIVLLAWTLMEFAIRKFAPQRAVQFGPKWVATSTVLAVGCWIIFVASITLTYLTPVLTNAVADLVRLGFGEETSTSREVFHGSTGQVDPLWERAVGLGSVCLIVLAIPVGLWQFKRLWKSDHSESLSFVLLAAALAYPGTMALRLTTSGAETSDRASAFVFLGVAFLMALALPGATRIRRSRNRHRAATAIGPRRTSIFTVIATLCLTVLFVGGITVGWSREARTPGPYLVVADPRSIEAKGVTAAEWVGLNLPPGNSIVTDRINSLLMAAYGRQNPQSLFRTADLLLFSDDLGETELCTIRDMDIRYLVVDERLTTGLPLRGFYMTRDEAGAYQHEKPIGPQSLAKFDGVPGIDRIFDNGDIIIYDVSSLLIPSQFSPHCLIDGID